MSAENRQGLYVTAETETILRERFNAGNGLPNVLEGANNAAISLLTQEQVARRSLLKAAVVGVFAGAVLALLKADTVSRPDSNRPSVKPTQEIPLPYNKVQTV